MNGENKKKGPYSFEQTHGGSEQFPGGEWENSSEFGKNTDFHRAESSDEKIREEACEALNHIPSVDASGIDVSVKEGHVTLTGTVANTFEKNEAGSCVENLAGVYAVHNELRETL